MAQRWPHIVVALALAGYLLISLPGLTVFPPVGEDEAWIAAAPYKLATQGVLGSDLFTGYYGMERHLFEHMPLFPLMQAGVFRLFGVGVAQMRALPLVCGLALLVVVFAVGRQIGGDRVGALAVVLMLLLRVADGDGQTGILVLDRARINRYDIAVPVFSLLALLTFNRAERDRRTSLYALTGLFTGLAGLSHLYGVFWLPVFAVVMIARRGWRTIAQGDLWFVFAGFAAAWLPWIAYVSAGWSDFAGQIRMNAGRFDLANPRFYIDNGLYGDGPISLAWLVRTIRALPLTRAGAWTVAIGAPIAIAAALRRGHESSPDVRALAVATLAQTAMFAALLNVKTVNYMIALWPLAALLLAWLGTWLWRRGHLVARLALVMLLGLIVQEGAVRVARSGAIARQVTPYDWYESEVAGCIPPGSLVLGLQRYWLGLRQFRYRSWLLPIDVTNLLYTDAPIGLEEALDRVNPDVVLVDRHIDELMTQAASLENANHRLHAGFEAFKMRRHATLTCVIRDHTYGTMQVYVVPRSLRP